MPVATAIEAASRVEGVERMADDNLRASAGRILAFCATSEADRGNICQWIASITR